MPTSLTNLMQAVTRDSSDIQLSSSSLSKLLDRDINKIVQLMMEKVIMMIYMYLYFLSSIFYLLILLNSFIFRAMMTGLNSRTKWQRIRAEQVSASLSITRDQSETLSLREEINQMVSQLDCITMTIAKHTIETFVDTSRLVVQSLALRTQQMTRERKAQTYMRDKAHEYGRMLASITFFSSETIICTGFYLL